MDVVFLDANVLYSAAYRPAAGLRRLWGLVDVELVTSAYAAEEARRNLASKDQRQRLDELLRSVRLITETTAEPQLPPGVRLPAKDVPILRAAIDARPSHLLTGDITDFGPLLDRTINGVLICTPADFLRDR